MSESPVPRRARAVPPEQRLFSVVLALVASTEGLTKHDLLSSVYGYADKFRFGESNPSLDRQFERDKELLRSLGIRIETIDSPLEAGNNQLTRYRIAKDQLEFPADLRFTERELMLLRLAAVAWREGSMTAEARRATMKLEALGAGLDVRQLGIAPSFGVPEPAGAPLQAAIDAGRVVEFSYALPGRDAPARRRVAPLRLHRADGRWHLISWDLERDDGRVFLLERIRSEVEMTRTVFDEALRGEADRLVAGLLEQAVHQRAIVEVASGSVAEARLAPRASADAVAESGAPALVVPALDLHVLADELSGYGGEAVVSGPAELRELVVGRLQRTLTAHTGEPAAPERANDPAPPAAAEHRPVRPAPLPAGDALTLLLSIVPYLLDHGPTPIAELAEVFDVSARRLEREIIPFLGTAGVPGETASYQHEDLFDIDWSALDLGIASLVRTVAVDETPRFAPVEAAALIAGLQSLAALLPAADAEAAHAAARKLGAAMGGEMPPASFSLSDDAADPALPIIVAALDARADAPEGAPDEAPTALRFGYRDASGAESTRLVDPIALRQESGIWYLRGHCADRGAERTFRVDRMRGIRAVRPPAGPVAHGEADVVHDDPAAETFDLVALVPERLLQRFAGFAPEVLDSVADRARVRIDAWNSGSAVRLVQEAPGEVVILSPARARTAVAEWAARALAAYDA
ncbi:WYL domain-containing protein [Leucobacter sp. gxy201]|uniref:helix-turn-helix transcriptional regulator n=1 Tax=Leucobacter sp. gxy201 TaxID=2957200 RepID=UPI003DA03ADD